MKYKKLKKKILNLLMINGNKKTSEKLLIKVIKIIQKKNYNKSCKDLIKIGLVNSAPILFLKTVRRKRKKTVKFPFLLSSSLRVFYGLKFILRSCLSKKKTTSYITIGTELVNSATNTSFSSKNKKDLHKEGFLNKKFANYRWF